MIYGKPPCRKCGDTRRYDSNCCPSCQQRRTAVWRAANPDRARAADVAWNKANPEKAREFQTRWRLNHPNRILLSNAKQRAKESGVPFDLDLEDIFIPVICPILGLTLSPNSGGTPGHTSPSLDRIKPTLGYIKGNVRVISWRANNLKRDATYAELRLVADDLLRIESA